MNERLKGYRHSEPEALRGLGGTFAERHPQIAGQLRPSPDPVGEPRPATAIRYPWSECRSDG